MLLVRQVNKEFCKLIESRNNLLHGTWDTDWLSIVDRLMNHPESTRLPVTKYTTSMAGVKQVDSLPKDIDELNGNYPRPRPRGSGADGCENSAEDSGPGRQARGVDHGAHGGFAL